MCQLSTNHLRDQYKRMEYYSVGPDSLHTFVGRFNEEYENINIKSIGIYELSLQIKAEGTGRKTTMKTKATGVYEQGGGGDSEVRYKT